MLNQIRIAAIAIGLTLYGCQIQITPEDNPTPRQIGQLNPQASSRVSLEAIRMTILPDQSSPKRTADITELKTYLADTLQVPVEIIPATNYDQAVELLLSGKVNVAYLGPLTYIEASEQDPTIKPIVAPIDKDSGRPWYTSNIISKIEIKELQDLRGKRFAFVNESSTSGFLIPNYHLNSRGIYPAQDFATTLYGEAHDQTLQLLLEGKVEAIAVDSATYQTAIKNGTLDPAKYHLLWESKPITNPPIVISGKLSPSSQLALQKAFINAPAGLVGINVVNAQGYTIVQDSDYELIRDLYRSRQ